MNSDLNPNDEISTASVILTGELRRRLRECAIRLGCSQSEIVRTALKAFFEKNSQLTTIGGGQ
jgi:predicted transcriptional regulator